MADNYIVRPRSNIMDREAALLKFLQFVEFVESVTDTAVISIQDIKPDPGSPKTIIISTSPSVADSLDSLYGEQFIIEKEETLPSPGPAGPTF